MNRDKGFTLIELLVVVAIVSLLASIVLTSLQNARLKSRDAFLKEQAMQMRNLLELEYSESGSYAALQPTAWISVAADCDAAAFTGNYAAKAKEICKAIEAKGYSPNPIGSGPQKFFVGNGADPTQRTKYSILVALPYKTTYYCLGSSGLISDTTNTSGDSGAWNAPGCFYNP